MFDGYRSQYSARKSLIQVSNKDEVEQINAQQGLFTWDRAPQKENVESISFDQFKLSEDRYPFQELKQLWVISGDSVVYALELGKFGLARVRGRLAHTNLTGGGVAYSGGELWFMDGSRQLVLNGASGRYRPRSSDEIDCVCEAFSATGFDVISMGWDEGTNEPRRVLRESHSKLFHAPDR